MLGFTETNTTHAHLSTFYWLGCLLIGPRQANLVLIAYASSECSGEPAHPRSLARTFAARLYKQWVKRNLQTESQFPSPSEWLGMRSWNLSWRNARRHKFAWRGSISINVWASPCGKGTYHMRTVKAQACLLIGTVLPEPSLFAHIIQETSDKEMDTDPAWWLGMQLWTFEPRHDKTNKMTVRPAKTQISLGICPVRSESSLCTQWVAKDRMFLRADSEDWSDGQADLSLRWACMPFCLFCHVKAHLQLIQH